MAGENGRIQVDVVVNSRDAESQIRTLKQQINETKAAIEKASQVSGTFINIDGVKKSVNEAIGHLDKLQSKLLSLESNYGVNKTKVNDTWLTSQIKQMEAEEKQLEALEERRKKVQSNPNWYSGETKGNQLEFSGKPSYDTSKSAKESAEYFRQQLMLQEQIASAKERNAIAEQKITNVSKGSAKDSAEAFKQQIALQEQISSVKERNNVSRWQDYFNRSVKSAQESAEAFIPKNSFMSYQQQLVNLNKLAEKHWQQWKLTGDEINKTRFDMVSGHIKTVRDRMEEFSMSAVGAKSAWQAFRDRVESHTSWIATGAMIAGMIEIPASALNLERYIDATGQKIKQNLELATRYHDNVQLLNSDVKNLTDVAGVFAVGYGADVKDVMDMMQVLSRRFKSPEELTYFTNLALTMHKLDFVEPKKAAEDLEAVILSMGLDFEGAKKFIDEFSVAVHIARITGTELLSGLQRSGATFQNMNFNTAEAIAMISTLSTVTAKAGANIGASLNSVLINVDFKKAAAALQAYNIDVYEVVDGHKKLRDGAQVWREIAAVFNGLDADKANEFANAMSGGKFRANDLRAMLTNWEQFESILARIQSEASPERTAELLKTGLDTFNTDLGKLQAALQVLGITVGENVLPGLRNMAIGLAQGVQWLNEHKEAVSNVITALLTITKYLIEYNLAQKLCNLAIQDGTLGLRAMYMLEGDFKAGFAGMSGAVRAFGITVATVATRLAVLYAISQLIAKAYDTVQQRNDEQEYMASVVSSERYLKGDDSLANKIEERDSKARIGADTEVIRLNQEIGEGLKGYRQNKEIDKVNQMVSAAEAKLRAGQKVEKPTYSEVEGQNVNPGSGNGGSSSDSPSSNANRVTRDERKMAQEQMFYDAKKSAESYDLTLSELTNHESIYGKTVESSYNALELKRKRSLELADEASKYTNEQQYLMNEIDTVIGQTPELLETVGLSQEQWCSKTKEERDEIRGVNKELLTQNQLIKSTFETALKYGEAAIKARKESVGLAHDVSKGVYGDTKDVTKRLSRKLDTIGSDEQIAEAGVDSRKPSYTNDVNSIKLKALNDRIAAYKEEDERLKSESDAIKLQNQTLAKSTEEEIKNLKTKEQTKETLDKIAELSEKLAAYQDNETDAVDKNTRAQKKNQAAMEQAKKEASDLTRKNIDDLRQWEADSFADMALEGKNFEDIMKNVWKSIAKDAINSMFGVQKQSTSLFSNLAMAGGKGKSGSAAVSTPSSSLGTYGSGAGTFGGYALKPYANGGVTDEPSLAGEDGEEVIIPVEKNTKNSPALLSYASKKLGIAPTGGEYVPYFKNQALASKPMVSVNISQGETIKQLQEANSLMRQQNSLLLNAGSNGNTTIVTTAVSSEQVLQVLQQNPQALQNILGRNKSNGWR